MSTIRAKRYAHPRIAMAKEREEKVKAKESSMRIKVKAHPIQRKPKLEGEAWEKLSEMTAWCFHGSYLKMKISDKERKEEKAETKMDKSGLLKVINRKIKEENAKKHDKKKVISHYSASSTNIIEDFFSKASQPHT